jgi:hypothetical protein
MRQMLNLADQPVKDALSPEIRQAFAKIYRQWQREQ